MVDATVSEMAGYIGYDYVWIDAEHAPLGRQEILNHVRAAQGSGCAVFVRVPGVDRAMLKAILDMGPDGIMSVKGIDSIFIGAADLSRSIKGRNDGTDLDTVYKDICKRVRATDKYLGVAIGATREAAERVKGLGAQWVVFGQDVRALSDGLYRWLINNVDYPIILL